MSIVTRDECDSRHEKEAEEVKDRISAAISIVESRIKLWVLGGLVAFFVTIGSSFTCNFVKFGSFQERVEQNTRDIERLRNDLDRLRYPREVRHEP